MSTGNYPPRPQSFQYPPPGPGLGKSGPVRVSARSSYPRFLSLQESALLQFTWAWRGLYDSFKWHIVVSTVTSDAEIRANVYKSLLLNFLSLASIYIFDLLLQPLVQDQQKWFHRNIGWFYQVLWLLPVVGASLYLNGSWCTIIAKRTYLLHHGGRPVAAQPTTYTGMLKSIATSAYRVVMVCTSVIVSFALGRVPLVGPTVGFLFMCWVDAYYCFEFVWISRGLSLSGRIRHLEERWAYYFAFGLPSTALCMWGSALANAALFALIFPAYIIMAMHARPYPLDPYNPSTTPLSSSSSSTDEDNAIRHPSPFIPIRLPIFAVVISINDAIVRVLNFVGGRPIVRHKHAASLSNEMMMSGSGVGRGTGAGAANSGRGRPRAFSDAEESAEDGNGGGLGTFSSFGSLGAPSVAALGPGRSLRKEGSGNSTRTSSPSPAPSLGSRRQPTPSSRINIGTRRKID